MISISQYNNYIFEDLDPMFRSTNEEFYNHCKVLGLEIDLSNKDQKTIYTHFFIKKLCERVGIYGNKLIFYINDFTLCDLHRSIIKKIIRIFGFKIWVGYTNIQQFLKMLVNRDSSIIDNFELFLHKENKPKSFRHIKKYLMKEGFTNLSDSYFQDIANKMAIMC